MLEEIFIKDIYALLCEKLRIISIKEKLDYQELHDRYLIDIYNQLQIALNHS